MEAHRGEGTESTCEKNLTPRSARGTTITFRHHPGQELNSQTQQLNLFRKAITATHRSHLSRTRILEHWFIQKLSQLFQTWLMTPMSTHAISLGL